MLYLLSILQNVTAFIIFLPSPLRLRLHIPSFLSGFQSLVPWGSLISSMDVLVCKYQVIDNYLVSVCLVHISLIYAAFTRMKNNAAICPFSPVYQCPLSILSWESIGSHYLSPVTYLNCISLASSKLLPFCFNTHTHTHRFHILPSEETKLRQGEMKTYPFKEKSMMTVDLHGPDLDAGWSIMAIFSFN